MKIMITVLIFLWLFGMLLGFEGKMIHSLLIIAALIFLADAFSHPKLR